MEERRMNGEHAASPGPQRTFIRIVADAAELTRVAAEEVTAALAAAAARSTPPPSFVLSGGSTPKALFRLLVDPAAPFRERIDWPAIHFFWGDERHVPPDHPDSNYRMAREAMLDHVPVPPAHVHRIAGEEPDAAAAARAYERELIAHFALRADRGDREVGANGAIASDSSAAAAAGAASPAIDWPRFDVLLLGLGEEGHTASLFPGSPALAERRHLVAAPWVAAHQTYRITLTPPALNHAATVVFLVSGAAKAAALAGVLEGDAADPAGTADPSNLAGSAAAAVSAEPSPRYPAQVISPVDGRLLWLVDLEAAAQLR
jgi:6-phosphogluconolactonase